ncbi:MAG: hypothetical protein CVU89_03000 [Firmicutes bacterium HGW-Firmicutes-14]|nr:MAG: hypothetical protein CVU89_03000 [Firmicutes bacterium HGW-Firmicutes-14]
MRKISLIALLAVCLVLLTAGTALAAHGSSGDRTGYVEQSALGCAGCHADSATHTFGPHGGYTSTSNKCQLCHQVHNAGSARLLPGQTVTDACQHCHDITGTDSAPYYASDLANPAYGSDVKASHRVFGTVNGFVYNTTFGSTTIPGGDATNGGDSTLDTSGQGALSGTDFTCNSCHTPHAVAANTVDIYLGESHVKQTTRNLGAGRMKIYLTNRILKRTVNGVDTGGTYGTEWCAGCHQGRDNMGDVFNHPVNQAGTGYDMLDAALPAGASWLNGSNEATVVAKAYVMIDTNGTPGGDADLDADPRSNIWYAMEATDPVNGDAARPDGNVPFATGSGPACQQCHASPRNVDAAFWAGFDTEGEGYPSRGTFPHLSTNTKLLVEAGDDFCTNCHNLNLP